MKKETRSFHINQSLCLLSFSSYYLKIIDIDVRISGTHTYSSTSSCTFNVIFLNNKEIFENIFIQDKFILQKKTFILTTNDYTWKNMWYVYTYNRDETLDINVKHRYKFYLFYCSCIYFFVDIVVGTTKPSPTNDLLWTFLFYEYLNKLIITTMYLARKKKIR